MRISLRFLITPLLGIVLFLTAMFLCYQLLFSYNAEDQRIYRELLGQADPNAKEAPDTPYTATQQHRHAVKDIWFTDKGQRLHICLSSADTELVLDHKDDSAEIVEHMYDVQCFMQEELYYVLPDKREVIYQPNGQLRLRRGDNTIPFDSTTLKPMQLIRYLRSEVASYYYKTDHFVADDVFVSHYSVPGHTLINSIEGLKPLMSGLAQSVEFSLNGNDLNFKAYQLRAILHTNSHSIYKKTR